MEILTRPIQQTSQSDMVLAAPVRRRYPVFALLLAAGWIGLPVPASAQPSQALETEIKAAFLVKFTRYTTWPPDTFASPHAPLLIGVLGTDTLGADLDREAQGIAASRPIMVRRVAGANEAAQCHVVFISKAESRHEAEWLAALKGKPVLTVAESEQAIERGAVMRFVIRNKNLRFEANLSAAAENHLKLNERMLAVAAKVYPRPPGN